MSTTDQPVREPSTTTTASTENQNKKGLMPACQHWKIKLDSEQRLWLNLDHAHQSTNVLDFDVLSELEKCCIHFREHYPNLKAVIFYSSKPSGFIAGADVNLVNNFGDSVLMMFAKRGSEEVRNDK